MRSAVDRFLLAFKQDRANAAPHDVAAYVRLYRDDPEGFWRAFEDAWQARRSGSFVSLCRALDLEAGLGAKAARRLVVMLLGARRFAEATELLQDPRFDLSGDVTGRLQLARALLGAGRADAAQAALPETTACGPDETADAETLDLTITAFAEAQGAAAPSRSWAATWRFINQGLETGAIGPAHRGLAAFLAEGSATTEDLPDIHEALDTIVSLAPDVDARTLFLALRRFYPDLDSRADIDRICAGFSGDVAKFAGGSWRTSGRDLRASGALAWAKAGLRELAIPALGELSLEFPTDAAIRLGLARAVGQDVLSSDPLRLAPARGKRRIYDAFLFHDELRMLKIKLHEMADWVDGFVLVEARETFTGAPKPLVFEQNRDQFAAFADKIIHVVVDAFPPHVQHPWAREFFQRDMGVRGLTQRCSEGDLVIISDVDEVISRSAVESFSGEYARLRMERARFFLNYREALALKAQREATSLWRASYLTGLGLSYARGALRADKKARRLWGSGWHFTSIGDSTHVTTKVQNSAHQEHAHIQESFFSTLLDQIREGKLEPGWERCELDERFPAYIREHPDEFADVLL